MCDCMNISGTKPVIKLTIGMISSQKSYANDIEERGITCIIYWSDISGS